MYVPSSLLVALADIVHVSEPYRRIGSTVALKIHTFSWLLMSEIQILCMSFEAAQAIPFLTLKSLSDDVM